MTITSSPGSSTSIQNGMKLVKYGPGVKEWSGYLEPTDESWILYLNRDGRPGMYYCKRESNGAVIEPGFIIHKQDSEGFSQ